jgi:hypothetical protein
VVLFNLGSALRLEPTFLEESSDMLKAPTRSMRPRMRPEAEENTSRALTEVMPRPTPRPRDKAEEFEAGRAIERGNRASEREAKKFANGGMVRGCKAGQMSGKGFRGDF